MRPILFLLGALLLLFSLVMMLYSEASYEAELIARCEKGNWTTTFTFHDSVVTCYPNRQISVTKDFKTYTIYIEGRGEPNGV